MMRSRRGIEWIFWLTAGERGGGVLVVSLWFPTCPRRASDSS